MVFDLCYIQVLININVRYCAVHVACNVIEVLPYVRETLRYYHMWHVLAYSKKSIAIW